MQVLIKLLQDGLLTLNEVNLLFKETDDRKTPVLPTVGHKQRNDKSETHADEENYTSAEAKQQKRKTC